MKRIEIKLLGLIIISGFLIRFIGLNNTPPSLNWDEVSHGYNAYSVLKNGRDEWGEFLPLIFRAFGDYKLPVYIYLTAISEFIFGLNALSVRLVSVIAGTATIFFTYKLSKKIFADGKVALLSAFLVAIEPWSFFVSRVALEANLALAFVVAGTYYALVGIEKRSKYIVLSIVLLGLSVWTYNSARIFVPLFLLGGSIIYRSELTDFWVKRKGLAGLSIFLLILFFVPMILQLADQSGTARYRNVSLLDEGAVAAIEQKRNTSDLPPILIRGIYNRPIYFGRQILYNYVSHFTPSFLFVSGGDDFQFNVPKTGLIYLIELPFVLLGGYFILKSLDRKEYRLIAVWVLLAPVASSITRGSPHVLRAILLLPMPMLLSSLGVVKFVSFFEAKNTRKFAAAIYFFILAILIYSYMSKYFTSYRSDYSWSWQYGYREMVGFVKENYEDYDKVVITKKYGEPHEFILFYWPWDPKAYVDDASLVRFNQSNWWWVDRFDRFYFVNDWDFPKSVNEEMTLESGGIVGCRSEGVRCLIVTDDDSAPDGWLKLKEINFLDGEVAFVIYEE